jgi:signal transduction histidine kinase
MKRSWVITGLTIVILLAVFSIGMHLHNSAKQEVASRFQEQQILHAHHIAERIENFFAGRAQVLKAFSTPISHRHESMTQLQRDLEAYAQEMAKNSVRKIFLHDASGRTVFSAGPDVVGPDDVQGEIIVWSRNPENKNKVFISPLKQVTQKPEAGAAGSSSHIPRHLQFILAMPLYDEAISGQDLRNKENFLGVISFTVELQPFLIEELHDAPMLLHDAWIIEESGTLLFHSRHPEMVFGNIYQADKNCSTCHESFDYVKAILKKKEGAIAFQADTSGKQLAGFAPMQFEDASWIVVMDSEDSRVTSYINKNLKDHLLLFGVAAFALTWSSVLIYRNHQAGVRAREELAHWQERLAERKQAEQALKESEQRLRFLSTRLLSAQEKERGRISRELHDELGQALATIKLQIGQIESKARRDQEIKQECAHTLSYLDQVIENVRRLSRDLSPAVLEHFGLSIALQRLLSDFAKNYNMKVSFDMIEGIDRFFSQSEQAIIYRIFQEVIHNTGKHAQATHVAVNALRQDGTISFMIEDNGKGFDMHAVADRDVDRKGLGLDIMKERAGMLGGVLEVSSEKGKGTRVTFRVPVAGGEKS